jgi:CHAD domain-containing protein
LATAGCRDFVIGEGDGLVRQRIATALQPSFTVAGQASRADRQVWLDTFDRRLQTAGLVLRQVTTRRSAELVLTDWAGAPLAAQPLRAPRWPRLIDVIPAGPLRDRLAPVVGIRALLPVARADGTLTGLRVLDGERKTVARVTVTAGALTAPVAGPLPARLAIAPVRGYDSAADQAGRLLTAAGLAVPAPRPAVESVLEAASPFLPNDADGAVAALAAGTPAQAAVAGMLLRLTGTIAANLSFVIRDVDTEFLHDLRVAVRRTRSLLKLAGDALPGDLAARFAPEFKWLGDLTTPVRDLDVYLTGFQAMAAGLRAASPADLEPFRAHLARRRLAERRRLVRGLRSPRFARLMAEWPAALHELTVTAGPDTGSLAAQRIARAHRRVLKRGAAVTAAAAGAAPTGAAPAGAAPAGAAPAGAAPAGAAPAGAAPAGAVPTATELHALRKRCKELRYLLEFFGSLYDSAAYGRALRELRGLQDCLGEFQDGEVQRDAVRVFAGQMLEGPALGAELAATLLAMGELTARLHQRQRRARETLAGRFSEFARAGGLRALGTGQA